MPRAPSCRERRHPERYRHPALDAGSSLIKRIWENKESVVDGFKNKYHVRNLVCYVQHHSANTAIVREN
jgi:hypothetical protein